MADSPRRKPRKLRVGPASADPNRRTESTSPDEQNIGAATESNIAQDMSSSMMDESAVDDGADASILSSTSRAEFLQELSNSEDFGHEPEGETLDERRLRRHFMDVESSFMPDVVSHPSLGLNNNDQHEKFGADDTYLELGKPHDRASESPRSVVQLDNENGRAGASLEPDNDQELSSSPAVAAAMRNNARHVSASTQEERPNSRDTARRASKSSTIGPHDSSELLLPPAPSTSAPRSLGTFASRSSLKIARQVSQHSAISTSTMNSDLSGGDLSGNADFAIQTGGATSDLGPTGRGRRADVLARMPSLGSVASFADSSDTDSGLPTLASLASLNGKALQARARFVGQSNDATDDRPETPRASGYHGQPPTDTVLAQRVQSIHVPDTVARDFFAKNRSFSPDKRPASSGVPASSYQDRPRRALTLKEQNAKIDKLTKENFDLKLKIHFLDQALQSRSDDGVKEMIDKNVQLQTDLANERKEAQTMRRKMRELERKLQEQARLDHDRERHGSPEKDEDPTLQADMHEEILYLRQQVDHSENQITTLREELMTKELEKRKMAEHMRSMAGSRGEDTAGMKETIDMWQDLLNAETGRREQAEDDLKKLRDELAALRVERASPTAHRESKLLKRHSRMPVVPDADEDADSGDRLHRGPSEAASVVEQLQHENAELRRDLGAQTSMLTSRNRERERLQQEIEDLKLLQRKSDGGRSVAGDSIFDRSISRAHQRAPSQTSDQTHGTQITEAERDEWDRKEGQLRDQNAELRLKFQELERTHATHLQYVAALESDFQEMENELGETCDDLRGLQSERDEALQAYEEKEAECGRLEQEALKELDQLIKEVESLESQLDEAQKRAHKTQSKLDHITDGYKGLQGELREITQSVMNLEDEKQASMRTIQTLEQQLAEAEEELQNWEQKCREADQKNRKFEITHESLHSEITFLREEQEGDKIKIGELEDALNAAQQSVQDEQEKLREMEESMAEERQQRDVLENQSKEEVQKVLDDLNAEATKTKDEIRRLRRALSAREVEVNTWKHKLDDLEGQLRSLLGDPQGTKQSLLGEIEKIQRDLESTVNQLDRARMEAADKDRLLRHRDGLLESTSLESRRLSDLLDKERASRKRDLEQFERASRGQATHMRHAAQQESRILDLETSYTQDKRKMAAQEQQFREDLSERNALLLALWHRLSTLCGAEWAQNHSLVNGELPSLDVIARSLPGFNRNVLLAVSTVESLIGGFKSRIRSIEKDLTRDYQTLEHNLTMRMRRMDTLEKLARDAHRAAEERSASATAAAAAAAAAPRPSTAFSSFKSNKGSDEIARLNREVKLLNAELKFHRQHPSAMAQQLLHQHNQSSPEHARRASSSGLSFKASSTSPARLISNLLRHHSTSAVERVASPMPPPPPPPVFRTDAVAAPSRPVSMAASTQQLRDLAHHQAPDDDHADARSSFDPAVRPLTAHVGTAATLAPGIHPSEQRWMHRLKELERRLKAEREGRLLDRRGARQRLEEGRLENEELRQKLEREKFRRESLAMSAHDGIDAASLSENPSRGHGSASSLAITDPAEREDGSGRGRQHAGSVGDREKSVD